MSESEEKKLVEIIEPDLETARLFQETQVISDDALAKANSFMKEMQDEYENEILDELREIKQDYARFRMAGDAGERKELYAKLSRQVLKVKSNAGMFGFELLTKLCELLFELLDHNYDVTKSRIEKSIELYINTLYIVYRRGLSGNNSEDAQKLVHELSQLNRSLAGSRG